MSRRDCGCRGRQLLMSARMARAVVFVLLLAMLEGARGSQGPDASSAEAPIASPRSELGPERYVGTYLYGGSDAERAAIEGAIDHATRGMPGRLIARGELLKRLEVRPSYIIRLDGARNCPAPFVFASPTSGARESGRARARNGTWVASGRYGNQRSDCRPGANRQECRRRRPRMVSSNAATQGALADTEGERGVEGDGLAINAGRHRVLRADLVR